MKKYNIFISHAWEYSHHYHKVVDWLDEAQFNNLLMWENYSALHLDTALNPLSYLAKEEFQDELDRQIQRASVVLILSGMYFAHPRWIEYEISKAYNYGKYIIGVKPLGQEYIPQVISHNAYVITECNKSSVINALLES